MMSKPKWKKFEELVTEVQRKLSPKSQVKHNDKIRGKTGALRQVDVSIRDTIGQFQILVVIDCKDQKDPVDLPDVEKWIGLVQDIGANKGAIVSSSGFTSPAITKGKNTGLNLYKLIDVGEHEWQTFVSIPVLCDFRRIKNCSFKFTTEPSYNQYISKIIQSEKDQRNIILYDKNNKEVGKIADFVNKKLEEFKTLTSPKQHDVIFHNDPIMLRYKNFFFEIRIGAKYLAERELRLGFVPLEEFSGFNDVVTKSVVTDGFTTSSININEVQEKWQKIETLDNLAIRPIITLTVPGRL